MYKFSTKRPAVPAGILLLIGLLLSNIQASSQADSSTTMTDTVTTEIEAELPAPRKKVIYHFRLYEDIMPAAGRLVDRAMDAAEAADADVIIMELNTYGGRVDVADSIHHRLLNAKALTVSYIVNNAASAGALISISCDSIYMRPSASIGAVTVVSQDGQQMPDKYQSYMRSKMRATAEAKGRNPDIAEAMVDDRIAVPGIIDSGKVLTFTASEALANDFCDGIVENLDDVIDALGIESYEIVEHQVRALDKVINFLLHPMVSSILMLLIFGGLYFELQTPGIGFPLAAAMVGATLYFAPLYLEGLAANWEILLFIVGLVLLGIELFVLPGFGVAGSIGIALIVSSLTLSLVDNHVFDFSLSGTEPLARALARVVLTLFVGIAMMVAFGGSIFNSPAFQRISLQDRQEARDGYTVFKSDYTALLGQSGTSVTDLRPSGKVEIGDEIYDALSEGGFIPRAADVKVLKIEANTLIVRQLV